MNLTCTCCIQSVPNLKSLFSLFRSNQNISLSPRQSRLFCNKAISSGEELSAPCPSSKLEDHLLSGLHHCSFDIFAATLHIAGRSSTHLRTRHSVATGAILSWAMTFYLPELFSANSYYIAILKGYYKTNYIPTFMNFILGRASDLYLCLYNQLFALFHHVFKVLTP